MYGVMVSDGLSDVITPCGLRLCRDLCETRSTCSSPDYSVETLTCGLGNSGLDAGQGGERECRTLTSRHGHNETVCSKGEQEAPEIITPATKVTEVKRPKGETDIDVSKLKSGTPVVLSNGLYGIFMGKTKVLFVDENIVRYMSLGDINIRSVMTYESGKAKVHALNSILVTAIAIRLSRTLVALDNFTNKDCVSYCMTRKTFAKTLEFSVLISAPLQAIGSNLQLPSDWTIVFSHSTLEIKHRKVKATGF